MPDFTEQAMEKISSHRFPGLPLGEDLVMPHYDGLSLVNLTSTVSQLLGAPAFGQPPLDDMLDAELGGPYNKVILLLVDALGYHLFRQMLAPERDLVWGRYFEQGVFTPITSICPSTTASALTTLWTGEGAAAHGVIGYEMWSKDFGMVINNILHSPANAKNDKGGLARAGFEPGDFMDKPLLGAHLSAHGVRPTTFIHAAIANSGLSVVQMRDVQIKTYVNEADRCVSLADHVNKGAGEREYIYVYYSDVDTLMHRYDASDRRVMLQFSLFSALFEDGFLNRLSTPAAEETLLILTADHGSIATPRYEQYDLANHPALMEDLVMQPTCEHRLPILYIKPGGIGKVRDYFADTWPEDFVLLDPEEALAEGLFGKGPYVDDVRDRLGDLIAVSRGDAYLWWSPRPNLMAGRHGGLSAGEMLMPFFALPLRHVVG
jgi:hypothetical protein